VGDGVTGALVGDGVTGALVGDGVTGALVGDGVTGALVGDGVTGARVGDGVKQEVMVTGTWDMPQVLPSLTTDATGLSEPSRRVTLANDSQHKHWLVPSFAPQSLFSMVILSTTWNDCKSTCHH
jgi:hypothetical protein